MPDGQIPSARRLIGASGFALFVALALLITVVLPAEYNIDPLGTGEALGLTHLSTSSSAAEETAPATDTSPIQTGPVALHGGEYKLDDVELVLGPYEYLEYKYRLAKGASLLYSWTASSSLIQDMHGESEVAGGDAAVSYEKRDRQEGSGAFTAPFAGIHGWYWENPGGDKVTIRMKSAGFYSAALEIRSNRTRRSHQLLPLNNKEIVP
jgi:hypothetical protein